jgi:hypothetical protein
VATADPIIQRTCLRLSGAGGPTGFARSAQTRAVCTDLFRTLEHVLVFGQPSTTRHTFTPRDLCRETGHVRLSRLVALGVLAENGPMRGHQLCREAEASHVRSWGGASPWHSL